MSAETLLVLTTCDDAELAGRLARGLVESRLAACVSAINGVTSTYRWNDKLESASEHVLLIKTTSERYAALEAFIQAQSGYDCPEVLAVRVDRGLAAYVDWVHRETAG